MEPMSKESEYTTSDVGIAAYLQLRGVKLTQCRRLSTGKFFFCFSDPSGTCAIMSLEYLESDYCKFDNNVRNLKKILFS